MESGRVAGLAGVGNRAVGETVAYPRLALPGEDHEGSLVVSVAIELEFACEKGEGRGSVLSVAALVAVFEESEAWIEVGVSLT